MQPTQFIYVPKAPPAVNRTPLVLANHRYEDVASPHQLAKPKQVQLLGSNAGK